MRVILAVLAILAVGSVLDTAQADPYKWCAVYSGGGNGGGGGNCYFLTIEQCRAQVSGVGGFCEPNLFYDGRPVGAPATGSVPHRKRS